MLTPTETLEAYLKNDRRNLDDINIVSPYASSDDLLAMKELAVDMIVHWNQAQNLGNSNLIGTAESNMTAFFVLARKWGY